MYANVGKFRHLTGFKEEHITNEEITLMIETADQATLSLSTTEVYDEKLTGNIDSSNTIFTTKHKPIADIDFDRKISENDVTVYLATKDDEDNRVSTETTVSSVASRDGRIILSSAPTSTTAKSGVFCDYRFYKNTTINFLLLEEAACYYLGFLAATIIEDRMANWSGISESIIIKLISRGGPLGAGRGQVVGNKWLDLCLRSLRVAGFRPIGKLIRKEISPKLSFKI